MLTFLPVIFLVVTALLTLFLRRLPRGTGYSWLTALFLTLLIWGGVLAIHWFNLPAWQLSPWRPFDTQNADPLIFTWDAVSWPLGLGMLSLTLALIITAPARLQQKSSPLTWAANLFISALGLLAVLAATPTATIFAWTLLDIVELVILTRLVTDQRVNSQIVIAFGVKILGTLFLFWAVIQSQGAGTALSYEAIQPPLGVFLLIAAGLRLGVLPLNIPYGRALPLQRGLTTMLRMTAQISSLVILARMNPGSIPENWARIIMPLTAMAALYGAGMWAGAKNELEGRRYWCLAFAGFSVASVLQTNSTAVIIWGLACLIGGGLLFFFSIRSKAFLFVPVLGLISLSGLPFTPTSGGIAGLLAAPYPLSDFLLLIGLALLLAGYLRLSLLPGEATTGIERWVFGVYPPGMAFLALSVWLITFLSLPASFGPGIWWASAIGIILAAGVFFLRRFVKPFSVNVDENNFTRILIDRITSLLAIIFRLNWFYRLLWSIFQGLQRFIEFITGVLEGEGGVLWALLLLALLLTILAGQGLLG